MKIERGGSSNRSMKGKNKLENRKQREQDYID
jgi:hypothetical protein